METLILLNPSPASESPFFAMLSAPGSLPVSAEQTADNKTGENLGPVYFTGRSPFKILVIILTRYKPAVDDMEKITGSFITYVGYKKEQDTEYDFDEMIPSLSHEEAVKTHDRACGFFSKSSLFIKSH